jgi:hypothetical protein
MNGRKIQVQLLLQHLEYPSKYYFISKQINFIFRFSRDHKTLYVGDARGRIFSWIVSDNPGRTHADHWIKDETVGACKDCSIRFSFAERRHHCRYELN